MGKNPLVTIKEYWIVQVEGIEQGWSSANPGVLEDPKPFKGYIDSIEWAFQASPWRVAAWRFSKPPVIDPSKVGPWWYKISKCTPIKIKETLIVEEKEEE